MTAVSTDATHVSMTRPLRDAICDGGVVDCAATVKPRMRHKLGISAAASLLNNDDGKLVANPIVRIRP